MLKQKKVPQRMCLGCRQMEPKKELIRIVRNKEGEFAIDFTGKKPGRGAYICNSLDCFKKLKKARGIERNYGCQVDAELYDQLEKELERGGD